MTVNQLKKFCLSFPGTTAKLHAAPSNILGYSVGTKHFAYFKTSDPEKWRFSVRVTPERFVELTDMPGVKPARYMARFHWVTIVSVRQFPADYLAELVDWSYQRALGSLSKTRQLAVCGIAARSGVKTFAEVHA